MLEYEVVIIGAGSAGLSARSEVAKITDSYLVIDPGPLGTTCARVGCMPSKALIEAANAYHRRHRLAHFGISGSDQLEMNPRKCLDHVRKLRDGFVASVRDGMESWRERFLSGAARFTGTDTIRVGDREIRFRRAIIATGTKPVLPSQWKPCEGQLLDTDTIFEQDDLPRDLAVVGLGAAGLELGQALSRLGVKISGFDPSPALGGLTSRRLQSLAAEILREDCDLFFEGVEPAAASSAGLTLRSGEREFEVEKVLLSVGRSAGLRELEPGNAGIELGDDGLPEFDPATLRIINSDVYIAGDASGRRPILHEAVDEGRIAGHNAVRERDHAFRRRVPLLVTFTDPEIALVGSTRQQLDASGRDYVVGEVDFSRQGRARLKLEAHGGAEVFLDKADGRILGAEFIAPGAEHLAHMLATAISMEASAGDVLAAPFYHPVLEEGLRTALNEAASKVDKAISGLTLMRCEEPPVGGCSH